MNSSYQSEKVTRSDDVDDGRLESPRWDWFFLRFSIKILCTSVVFSSYKVPFNKIQDWSLNFQPFLDCFHTSRTSEQILHHLKINKIFRPFPIPNDFFLTIRTIDWDNLTFSRVNTYAHNSFLRELINWTLYIGN